VAIIESMTVFRSTVSRKFRQISQVWRSSERIPHSSS